MDLFLVNQLQKEKPLHNSLVTKPRKDLCLDSQVALEVKNPPASAGNRRHAGSIPGSGRAPGGGHGNPRQYSRLENSMDCIVHGVNKESDTTERLSLSLSSHSITQLWFTWMLLQRMYSKYVMQMANRPVGNNLL